MFTYAECMLQLASAYRAYLRTSQTWTLAAFEVWTALLDAADRGAAGARAAWLSTHDERFPGVFGLPRRTDHVSHDVR